MTLTIIAVVIAGLLVLGSEFVNGWTDAPNAIATLVSTRVLSTRQAISMAVVLNVAGTLSGMLIGNAVAETMGKGIVNPSTINLLTISAALVSIIVWSSIAAHFGIPTSESHALVAGISGAAIATAGFDSLQWAGWSKVLIGILAALFLGSTITWLISKLIIAVSKDTAPRKAKRTFDRLQIFAGGAMAFTHGLNDGQKFMGVFTLVLVMGGVLPSFHIPLWIILLCAITMGLGTMVGGEKIIGTLGEKIAKIESWQGFAALTGSSATIFTASLFGIPLSTTHAIVASVTGSGASLSPSYVRWKYPRQIAFASVITFPLCGAIAWLVCTLFQLAQSAYTALN